jgi:hypothetical protein
MARTDIVSTITGVETERERLVAQARAAEAPQQIKVAKAALKRWQADHPNDLKMNGLLADLSIREAWLRIKREWE